MPVIERDGDLFDPDNRVIIHGCNARGGFGSGVAGQMARLHPEAKAAYLAEFKAGRVYPGRVIWVKTPSRIIANAVTQLDYGGGAVNGRVYVDYDAVRECFRKVNKALSLSKMEGPTQDWFGGEVTSLSMPRIGAGLAGGDWNRILDIAHQEFRDVDVTVWNYVPVSKPCP
jgi:O-acetyl-ADP-ribose deacetylase (regulator of RNase III)